MGLLLTFFIFFLFFLTRLVFVYQSGFLFSILFRIFLFYIINDYNITFIKPIYLCIAEMLFAFEC